MRAEISLPKESRRSKKMSLMCFEKQRRADQSAPGWEKDERATVPVHYHQYMGFADDDGPYCNETESLGTPVSRAPNLL